MENENKLDKTVSITVCRESFATDEDWETVLEEIGVDIDDKSIDSVTLYIADSEIHTIE